MTACSNSNNLSPMAAKAKQTARKRRPRRALPQDLTDLYITDSPTDLDVIAGRGGGSNHHEGNKRYWRRILVERPEYKQLGKNENAEKNLIAGAIYEYIITTGGRFLQLDSKTQKWFVIPRKISLDKIKQALRDKYVPNFVKDEPQSPVLAPLSTPKAFTIGEREEFLDFLNKKSSVPKNDFFNTNAPSIDIASILEQISSGKLDISEQSLSSKDFAPFQQSLPNFMPKPPKESVDLSSVLGRDLVSKNMHENWSTSKSSEFGLQGNALDHLMRGDLIATVDNMNDAAKTSAPEVPKSLQALLQQQMEAAIPSSRRTFVAAV